MAKKKRKTATRISDAVLTVGEAAERLEVTPATLRNWDRSGKLKSHRHPVNKYRLYKAQDVEAMRSAIRGL